MLEAKQAKIREVLEYIQERLEELETEKEELKEFQEKDKERRCLEYSLYQAELTEITQALDEVLFDPDVVMSCFVLIRFGRLKTSESKRSSMLNSAERNLVIARSKSRSVKSSRFWL